MIYLAKWCTKRLQKMMKLFFPIMSYIFTFSSCTLMDGQSVQCVMYTLKFFYFIQIWVHLHLNGWTIHLICYIHWRQTGLNSMGASISTTSGRGRKRGTLICIISGRGRKTVGASAPTAPISSAPLDIEVVIFCTGRISHKWNESKKSQFIFSSRCRLQL